MEPTTEGWTHVILTFDWSPDGSTGPLAGLKIAFPGKDWPRDSIAKVRSDALAVHAAGYRQGFLDAKAQAWAFDPPDWKTRVKGLLSLPEARRMFKGGDA